MHPTPPQDRFGSLFFMLMYLALMGLSSLPIWRDDRLLFVRERAAGAYGTHAYFTAVRRAAQCPACVVACCAHAGTVFTAKQC